MQVSKTGLAALALSLLAAPAQAQIQVFGGPDEDRRSSTVVMFGENVIAGVSISYSAPDWKADYDKPGAMDSYKGKNVRLGKNWWTSLDTNIPLEIGGTKLEPGAYYLGLRYGEDGSFKLLVLDASKAMKNSMMPFNPDGWKGGTTVDLKMNKDSLDESKKKMVIDISASEDDPSKGSFSIQWGKHELAADVKFQIAGGDAKKQGSRSRRSPRREV